jgi:ClpP class serine protease
MYEKEGVKIDVIRSGQHKAAGAYNTSLTSDQRMLVQAEVNSIATAFADYVFGNRGSVPIDGRTVIGYDSVAVGLADELVGDLAEAVRLFKSKE